MNKMFDHAKISPIEMQNAIVVQPVCHNSDAR